MTNNKNAKTKIDMNLENLLGGNKAESIWVDACCQLKMLSYKFL